MIVTVVALIVRAETFRSVNSFSILEPATKDIVDPPPATTHSVAPGL